MLKNTRLVVHELVAKPFVRVCKIISRTYLRPVISRLPKPIRNKKFGYSLVVIIVGIASLVGLHIFLSSWYKLDRSTNELLTKSSITQSNQLKETKDSFRFNSADDQEQKKLGRYVLAANVLDSTAASPYRLTLPKDPSKGLVFGESKPTSKDSQHTTDELSFSLTPQFRTLNARQEDGRVVYPINSNTAQVYTLKRNGIKEDIVMSSAPNSGTASFSWKLDTGNRLEARLEPDGSVGLYASDSSSLLNSDITISDEKSQKLIDNARNKQTKTELKFGLPKPFILDSNGNKRYEGVSFELKDNLLTLRAEGLKTRTLNYPISIDPSIIVTTTADFRTGNDDGLINYSTADQVTRGALTQGVTTVTTNTNYFSFPRSGHTSVAYNGYLYVIGGAQATSDTNCKNAGTNSYCNDIQYALINANGSIGSFTTNTNYFSFPRSNHTSVAYNGYLYVIGGFQATSNTNCKNAGTNSYCNDIQYSLLQAMPGQARYERTINAGSDLYRSISGFTINGTAVCQYTVSYSTTSAASSYVYNSATTVNVSTGDAVTVTGSATRLFLRIILNDQNCGTQSNITDIVITFNGSPEPPILALPTNSATNASLTPELRLGSIGNDTDYLRYKIDVCSTSNCSVIVRTIDQTSSQTGWQSQSQQSGTAYSGDTTTIIQYAVHQYQTAALTASTQYWWRAYAIDPGGSNQWSVASTISTFTTGSATPANINVNGSTNIYGGSTLKH